MTSISTNPATPVVAFHYLRDQARAAHLAGEGAKVLHFAAVALQKLHQLADDERGTLAAADVRWAFLLGIYWTVDEWFLDWLYESRGRFPADSPADRALIEWLYNAVYDPVAEQSIDQLRETILSLAIDNREIEDFAALSLAVELCWRQRPTRTSWTSLVDCVHGHFSKVPLLEPRFSDLRHRLDIQMRLFDGAAVPDEKTFGTDLARAWLMLLNCEWTRLQEWITGQGPQIGLDSPRYIPFFELIQLSRVFRRSKEDQLLSLTRRNYAIHRQSAAQFDQLRRLRTIDSFNDVLTANSNRGDARGWRHSLRLAVLGQLQALRDWRINRYREATQLLADICLKLSQLPSGRDFDPMSYAKLGIISAMDAGHVPEVGMDREFEDALHAVEMAGEAERRHLIDKALSLRPFDWPDSMHLFAQMRDAIPEELLPQVAAFSVRVADDDSFLTANSISWLDFFEDILPYVSDPEPLCRILHPSIVLKVKSPNSAHSLHDLIVEYLRHSPKHDALEVFNILTAQSETGGSKEQVVSIMINGLGSRPDIRDVAWTWLRSQTLTPIAQHIVEFYDIKKPGTPVDNALLRDWLRNQFRTDAEYVLSNSTTTWKLGGSIAHRVLSEVTWPTLEIDLINLMVRAVERSDAPASTRINLVGAIGELGQLNGGEAGQIAASAVAKWLDSGVPAPSFGMGNDNPMSSSRFVLVTRDQMVVRVLLSAARLVLTSPEVISQPLEQWLIESSDAERVRGSPYTLDASYRLGLYCLPSGKPRTELLAIGEEAIAAADAKDLHWHVKVFTAAALEGDQRLGLTPAPLPDFYAKRWTARLAKWSTNPDPSLREAVADAIVQWKRVSESRQELIFPTRLGEIIVPLQNDPRLRVRRAASRPDSIFGIH